jgi:glycosyltransferase involved in cell wall biosynthesis
MKEGFMKDQINILLATYQGGSYLQEQLRSIMEQSYPHFHIIIRDDGSQDQTLSIIESFRQSNPERISVIPFSKRLGAKGNFSELMTHAKAPYIMFCDQDDLWLPHKVESSIHKMKEMEHQYGSQIPLLIHTDMQVVKSDLTSIDSSFWHYAHINPLFTTVNRLLVQNNVTGCTAIMNQKLLQLSHPIPNESIMHDWWIALVASLFGKIDHINEPMMLYRQHGQNHVGAKKFGSLQWIKSRKIKRKQRKYKYEQAHQLLERYSPILNSEQKEILQAYYSSKDLSFLRRMKRNFTYSFIRYI